MRFIRHDDAWVEATTRQRRYQIISRHGRFEWCLVSGIIALSQGAEYTLEDAKRACRINQRTRIMRQRNGQSP